MNLTGALAALRDVLATAAFPLPGDADAAQQRDQAVHQLDDYVIPRVESLDAPLLVVVGGSTGSGKSTLVNSVLGAAVSASSAIRPTTRRPVLIHHPDDAAWFETSRILPSLARVRQVPDAASNVGAPSWHELEIRSGNVPQGLALLDAPDIDSVVDANRELAQQLLAAADVWVFVTTAARYADAVPWDLLHDAASRNVLVAVVLNRVPADVRGEVEPDARRVLREGGLGDAPLFVVEEGGVSGGLLPAQRVAPVREWLNSLAESAVQRAQVAQRTVRGAVDSVLARSDQLGRRAQAQADTLDEYAAVARTARAEAVTRIEDATKDGTLLRGEVLARWQEFVGTGEFFKGVEATIGRIRDRVGSFLRGKPAAQDQVEAAIEDSLVTLLRSECTRAAVEVDRSWRTSPASRELLATASGRLPDAEALRLQVEQHVVAWQKDLLAMVRAEGAGRRSAARAVSLGVNGLAVVLMIVIFSASGGLTGAEVATAGGAAVVGQKLLELVFGDEAVRRMARKARSSLTVHAQQLLDWHLAGYLDVVDEEGVDPNIAQRIDLAIADVRAAARRQGLDR